ncbi:hypothetical protein J1N35_044975 [Gossypium stocksii]|uniref:DUF8040 domain-containing protein n=1 Tax=Gossypium stocksii TaxID=47602 RepID=A0A9D3UA27_9ROSI|nr:hypothetical protein J1N35_044975 [Gossypium stocksii]
MEKLALSLYILGNRESNSNAAERFQRSGEIVSRIFTDMLHIFTRMGIDTIKPTEGQFEEDYIGAIDGTHIKACISPSCQIPYIGRKGKYYLVDSRYPQMVGFLGPYRGERYHLPDFHRGNHRVSGKKEIFNYAHSSLRSVIKRTFGESCPFFVTLYD